MDDIHLGSPALTMFHGRFRQNGSHRCRPLAVRIRCACCCRPRPMSDCRCCGYRTNSPHDCLGCRHSGAASNCRHAPRTGQHRGLPQGSHQHGSAASTAASSRSAAGTTRAAPCYCACQRSFVSLHCGWSMATQRVRWLTNSPGSERRAGCPPSCGRH